jgi:hypothetical protein
MITVTHEVKAIRKLMGGWSGEMIVLKKKDLKHLLDMYDLLRLKLRAELIKTDKIEKAILQKYMQVVIEETGQSFLGEAAMKLSLEQRIVLRDVEKNAQRLRKEKAGL